MTNQRLVILVVAVAIVSIAAVVVSGGKEEEETADIRQRTSETTATTERERPRTVDRSDIPDDPEKVLGTAEYALTRPRNLRAALAVLQREGQKFEGRFDYFRIAPGRIDTTLVRSDKRSVLQIRPDLKIPFRTESEFPSGRQALENNMSTREVDSQMPRRILNAIDLIRPGQSAARDLDYMVVQKSIIDGTVSWSAYLQSGRSPRQFSVEGGKRRIRLRVIG